MSRRSANCATSPQARLNRRSRLCDHACSLAEAQSLSPEISRHDVELILDNGLTDIVTERYDAGVRMGEHLAKDMISARISSDFCLAVVRCGVILRRSPQAEASEGPRPTHLHQFPAAKLRGHVCVGIRGKRPGNQNPRRRPACLQQHLQLAAGDARWFWPRIHSGRNRRPVRYRGTIGPGPSEIFAVLGRVPPLLPKPQAIVACLCRIGGRAASPPLIGGAGLMNGTHDESVPFLLASHFSPVA